MYQPLRREAAATAPTSSPDPTRTPAGDGADEMTAPTR